MHLGNTCLELWPSQGRIPVAQLGRNVMPRSSCCLRQRGAVEARDHTSHQAWCACVSLFHRPADTAKMAEGFLQPCRHHEQVSPTSDPWLRAATRQHHACPRSRSLLTQHSCRCSCFPFEATTRSPQGYKNQADEQPAVEMKHISISSSGHRLQHQLQKHQQEVGAIRPCTSRGECP